jgi:hypothetical protein
VYGRTDSRFISRHCSPKLTSQRNYYMFTLSVLHLIYVTKYFFNFLFLFRKICSRHNNNNNNNNNNTLNVIMIYCNVPTAIPFFNHNTQITPTGTTFRSSFPLHENSRKVTQITPRRLLSKSHTFHHSLHI